MLITFYKENYMRGDRNDLKYSKIIKFIEITQPVPVRLLHNFIENIFTLKQKESRSRIIRKLIIKGIIKRIGNKSRNAFFTLHHYLL